MTLLHQAAQKAVEAAVSLAQIEELAKTMWKGEPVPGRVLRFGAAVLGLVDATLQHQEVPREPVADFDQEYVHAYLQEALTDTVGGAVDPEVQRFMTWLAASPSTTRQQEVGSGEVVAYHDKDQPNGVAWCPGYPEKLLDIVPLYAGERTSKKLRAMAAAPSTPENADGGPHG